MKVILTGGAGFIGSVVLRQLNDKGISEVFIVDDLGCDDKWRNLVGKSFIDIIPIQQLWDQLPKLPSVDGIIHLGACSSTVETNADYLLNNNTHYTLQLCKWAMQQQIRFIYASSAATYGDGSEGFSDDHNKLDSLKPLNMYGYSKHLVDLHLKRLGWLDRVVGLKYFNVFGPNEFHKGRMASAVIKMMADLKKDETIRLFKSSDPQKFSDGEQVRDFIYVKDAAHMTIGFLFNEACGIFNVGSGLAQSWNDLAKAVIKANKGVGRIEYIDMPSDLIGKYQNYTCADMSKSHHCEVYASEYTLEKAVKDYVQNYILPDVCY